jgi:hypothetical protein
MSQPRNFLSMARLNIARSQVRCSIWSLVQPRRASAAAAGLQSASLCSRISAWKRVARNRHGLASSYSLVAEEVDFALCSGSVNRVCFRE